MTPSTHSNTELKEYMEKNKYNKNPIIDLSRHAAKVDELELLRESSTEKKKTANKRRPRTQRNTDETPSQKKIRNIEQRAPPSASLIKIPQKTEACKETESDANEPVFATFCNNFDWNKPVQHIETEDFKKKLSALCQTITGFPLNLGTPVDTSPNDFIKHGNINGKDKDLQWLADEGKQIIDDFAERQDIRIVLLAECDELSEKIVKQLFGAKNMLNRMASETGWLVLKVRTNNLVYDLYTGKVDTFAKPWAIAALDFVRKAQENGWTLNLIWEKHPTNEYIILCTR